MAHKISNLQLLILAARPCAAGTGEYFSGSLAVAAQAVFVMVTLTLPVVVAT